MVDTPTPQDLNTWLRDNSAEGEENDNIGVNTYPAPAFGTRVLENSIELFFSNNPEEITNGSGEWTAGKRVLYRSTVCPNASPTSPGKFRVFLHHINSLSSTSFSVYIVLHNDSGSAANTYMLAYGWDASQTEANAMVAGQNVLTDYLHTNKSSSDYYSIPNGQAQAFQVAGQQVSVGRVVSAMVDFQTDQPLSVVALCWVVGDTSYTDDSWLSGSNYFADDNYNRGRGTYLGPDIDYSGSYDTASDIARTRLGDNDEDPNLSVASDRALNFDASQLKPNYGNFGVVYNFSAQLTSSDGRNVAIMLNPRAQSGFRGLVDKFNDSGTEQWPEIPAAGQISVSAGQIYKAALIEEYTRIQQGKNRSLSYVLPAGSAAPVHICFIPYS